MESHSNDSLGDSLAISSNLTGAVEVEISAAMVVLYVHNTSNGERFAAFNAIESKIPALTANQTVSNSEIAVVFHFQSCVVGIFRKNTFLKTKTDQI